MALPSDDLSKHLQKFAPGPNLLNLHKKLTEEIEKAQKATQKSSTKRKDERPRLECKFCHIHVFNLAKHLKTCKLARRPSPKGPAAQPEAEKSPTLRSHFSPISSSSRHSMSPSLSPPPSKKPKGVESLGPSEDISDESRTSSETPKRKNMQVILDDDDFVLSDETTMEERARRERSASPTREDSLVLKFQMGIEHPSRHDRFHSIAGQKKLKTQLDRIFVRPREQPSLYSKFMSEGTPSMILWGPPGTGKSTIAKSVAAQMKVNFLRLSPADLSSIYQGEPAILVKAAFQAARKSQPVVLFLDEFDAMITDGTSDGYYMERINQLKIEMGEVYAEQDGGIFIIAATNENPKEKLNSAIINRFSKILFVGKPDAADRKAFIKFKFQEKGQPFKLSDADLDVIAACTEDLAYRDLRNIMQDAVREAIDEIPRNAPTKDPPPVRLRHFDTVLKELGRIRSGDEPGLLNPSSRKSTSLHPSSTSSSIMPPPPPPPSRLQSISHSTDYICRHCNKNVGTAKANLVLHLMKHKDKNLSTAETELIKKFWKKLAKM